MKMIKIFSVMLLLMLTMPLCASAVEQDGGEYYGEQMDASGASELYESISDETRDLLDELGIESVNFSDLLNTSPRKILDMVFGLLTGKIEKPLKILARTIAIIILLSIADSFVTNDEKSKNILGIFGALLLTTVLISPLVSLINASSSAVKMSCDFNFALIPVLAAIVAASGNPMLALSYNSLSFAAAQGVAQLVNRIVLPFCGIIAAMGITEAFVPEFKLSAVTELIKKTVTKCFSGVAVLFGGLLSIKGTLASSADTLASKGIKLAVSSFVPVVGSAVSEAYSSVAGSAALVRSTVGAFAIIAVVIINLPIVLELFLWSATIKISEAVADLFGNSVISSLLKSIEYAILIMNASVIFSAILIVISAGLTLLIKAEI